jgi:hypothetical protein
MGVGAAVVYIPIYSGIDWCKQAAYGNVPLGLISSSRKIRIISFIKWSK